MAPHEGLVHLKKYDIKDSNVELIGTDLDHKVKYNSAATEPAWNEGGISKTAGLHVWRIEDFKVVPVPKDRYGQFYDGDSYVVLHSYKVGDKDGQERLGHDIFFWLGSHTSQDEAGVAAYKTVELDEFLHGAATQHRELQDAPSEEFTSLFPRMQILRGGVASGFTHVEAKKPEEHTTLLRVFRQPGGRASSIMVYEVEPTWKSLDEDDVFILDKGQKIWVWQGKKCSPMEKAKAAQVVHDMTLAKHVDVEVLAQADSRSRVIVNLLGGQEAGQTSFEAPRPCAAARSRTSSTEGRPRRLMRLSDASGQLKFDLVKEGAVQRNDLDGNDVFIIDTGSVIWVWQGQQASASEKAMWIKVAQGYVRYLQEQPGTAEAYFMPISKVLQGNESPAFLKALGILQT